MTRRGNDKGATSTLYVVATPLGNLQDITARAVEILGSVDLVVAEDTRRTRKLLAHFGISAPLESYHGESSPNKASRLVEQLKAGARIALLSDSGTPAVSDPGAELVRAALDGGIRVVAIPGPSAVTAAFSVAGIAAGGFVFAGYPPRKRGEKRQFLQQIAADVRPTVFYEAPHRVVDTLEMLAEICPERRILVARELTKLHEELRHGPVAQIAEHCAQEQPRGEFTVVLSPAPAPDSQPRVPGEGLREAIGAMLAAGMSHRDAARVVELLSGLSRNEAYGLVESERPQE